MEKYQRRATGAEILSLRNQPEYLTATRKGREDEKAYVKRCMELFDAEKKRLGPNFRVTMRVTNGIPHFSGYKQSLMDQAVSRKITRTLNRFRNGLKEGVPRDTLSRKIDRIIRKYSEE